MIKDYGISDAHNCAVACNALRRAVRDMANEAKTDLVGLSFAANVLDQVADALDRHNQITNRELAVRGERAHAGVPHS